jgi:hypothetical protein
LGAAQIIGKRGKTELAADIAETAHQKGALVHPLFDRTERVLDDLAAPIQQLGPGLQAFGHPVQNRFVLQP